jgi:Rieske Fe-S protein
MRDRREERTADRVDKLVSDVLGGRHLKATPSDAAEREAIRVAARLAGVRDGYPRMSPAFRRRLSKLMETGKAPPWMDRRAALVAGLGIAVGAGGGMVAQRVSGIFAAKGHAPATDPSQPRTAMASRDYIEPHVEVARWVDTGLRLTDMVENVPVRVTAGAIGAFVIRRGKDVVGMSAFCTHLPCELVWQSGKKVLNCPCHNLEYNLSGESLRNGYPLPSLPWVKARVTSSGHVEVYGT